jgi:D-inositol-3-phosphate glycosyltransferase
MAAPGVRELFKSSHVLLMPSLSEGLSLVTIEALRDGLAIVASGIPGIDDVVVDGVNGILCDPMAPPTYAEALASLVDNPARLDSMRRAALERAPLYDAELMIDSYEKLLLEAAGSGR